MLLLTNVDVSSILDASTFVNAIGRSAVSRVQLALNVADIDEAVRFYSKLFGTEPTKRRPGYANFAIAMPPLKLVLFETPDARGQGIAGALNHLGIEVETPEEVHAAARRLSAAGLAPEMHESTTCCYAVQDKAWVNDPDGAPWEVYTVLADAADATELGCSTETCAPLRPPTAEAGPEALSSDSCC
jgi:catechol 2,3-dioxygenase-like lactoylglutathione lyase family enzyme